MIKKTNGSNIVDDPQQSNKQSFHKYKKSNQGLKPVSKQKPKSSPTQTQYKKDHNHKNHISNNINNIHSSHKTNPTHEELQSNTVKTKTINHQLDLINDLNFNIINFQKSNNHKQSKSKYKLRHTDNQSYKETVCTPIVNKSNKFVNKIRAIVNEEPSKTITNMDNYCNINQANFYENEQKKKTSSPSIDSIQQQQQQTNNQQQQHNNQQQQQYLQMRMINKENVAKNEQLVQLQKQENRRFQWKIGDLIGQGSVGQVYRAMNLESGQIFAVKRYNLGLQYLKLDPEGIEAIVKEMQIIQQLKHSHIVNYQGYQMDDDYLYIFIEYQSGGSIAQLLQKYGPFNVQTIKRYAKQILLGLECMHDNRIIHKDLKGSNILVNNQGQVKISDFGCSNQIEHTLTANLQGKLGQEVQGSIPWMAPETIQQSYYGRKTDIWGFGCVILEMATARRPWSNYDFDNPIQAILKIGQGDELPYIPETLPSELNQFIHKCLVRDYKTRPTVKQILEDSFIN